jgi:hypothetical protein
VDEDGNATAGKAPRDASGGNAANGGGAIPKLTMSQRVLAALPNLQREPKAPRPRPGPRTARGGDTVDNASGDESEAVSPDAVLEPPSSGVGAGTGGRLRDSFLTPSQPAKARGAPSGMTKEELVVIIKRLDERERVMALFSAPLGVVVGVVLTIAALHYNPPIHHKGHLTAGTIVYFEGGARVLLSVLVGLAAWTRRRSFVAFALLFLGTSMGFPFALPFWVLGVWLIFRVFKWQKELTAMTRGTAATRAPSPRAASPRATSARAASPRTTSARATSTRTGAPRPTSTRAAAAEARLRARADARAARASGRRGRKSPPEPTGPPPSKRYTPPKPTRPRPPAAS